MALFRMTAAFGLLLAVAPEPTLQAVRQAFGLAEGAAPAQAATAEAALSYCRANPEICVEAARRAVQPQTKPTRS